MPLKINNNDPLGVKNKSCSVLNRQRDMNVVSQDRSIDLLAQGSEVDVTRCAHHQHPLQIHRYLFPSIVLMLLFGAACPPLITATHQSAKPRTFLTGEHFPHVARGRPERSESLPPNKEQPPGPHHHQQQKHQLSHLRRRNDASGPVRIYFIPFFLVLSPTPTELSLLDVNFIVDVLEAVIEDYIDEYVVLPTNTSFVYAKFLDRGVTSSWRNDNREGGRKGRFLEKQKQHIQDHTQQATQYQAKPNRLQQANFSRHLTSSEPSTIIRLTQGFAQFDASLNSNFEVPSIGTIMEWISFAIDPTLDTISTNDETGGLLTLLNSPSSPIASFGIRDISFSQITAPPSPSPTSSPEPTPSPTETPTTFHPTATPSLYPSSKPSLVPTSKLTLSPVAASFPSTFSSSQSPSTLPSSDSSISTASVLDENTTGGEGESHDNANNNNLTYALIATILFLVIFGGASALFVRNRRQHRNAKTIVSTRKSVEWEDQNDTNPSIVVVDVEDHVVDSDELFLSTSALDTSDDRSKTSEIQVSSAPASWKEGAATPARKPHAVGATDEVSTLPPTENDSPGSKTRSTRSSDWDDETSSSALSSTFRNEDSYSSYSGESFQRQAQQSTFVLRKDMLSIPVEPADGSGTSPDLSGSARVAAHTSRSQPGDCVLQPSHLTARAVIMGEQNPTPPAGNPYPYHTKSAPALNGGENVVVGGRPSNIAQATIERKSNLFGSSSFTSSPISEGIESANTHNGLVTKDSGGSGFVNLEFEPPEFDPDVMWDPDDNDASDSEHSSTFLSATNDATTPPLLPGPSSSLSSPESTNDADSVHILSPTQEKADIESETSSKNLTKKRLSAYRMDMISVRPSPQYDDSEDDDGDNGSTSVLSFKKWAFSPARTPIMSSGKDSVASTSTKSTSTSSNSEDNEDQNTRRTEERNRWRIRRQRELEDHHKPTLL